MARGSVYSKTPGLLPVKRSVVEGEPAGLHGAVRGSSAPFRGHPGDVLTGVFDVAGFAVNAILGINLESLDRTLINDLVDAGGTVTLGRLSPARQIYRQGNLAVSQLQMRRLVFLVIGVGQKNRTVFIKGEYAVRSRVLDRHRRVGRHKRIVIPGVVVQGKGHLAP